MKARPAPRPSAAAISAELTSVVLMPSIGAWILNTSIVAEGAEALPAASVSIAVIWLSPKASAAGIDHDLPVTATVAMGDPLSSRVRPAPASSVLAPPTVTGPLVMTLAVAMPGAAGAVVSRVMARSWVPPPLPAASICEADRK